jgi:2-methylcitrate dehydratase PrpD
VTNDIEPLSERFSAHAANTRFEDLPADAIERAKIFILDTLGVGIAGSSAPGARELFSAARGWGAGDEARIWGRRDRVPAGIAALVNGYQVHCQEFDCVCESAVLHPLATLLPAALAFAERRGGVSGRDLITAVAVGADVSGYLGIASTQALRFFRPATAGGLGAAAAVGRLAGFDEKMIAHAIGIQYAQSSGTMQAHVEASPVLPMQVGFNARAALQSIDIAATGIPAPRFSLDGPYGFLPLMEGGFDLSPVLEGLGHRWLVAELSHKPFPAGRATHGGIEGALALQAEHRFAPDDVAEIVISGPPVLARLTGRPDVADPTPAYARLCMGYVVAKALLRGRLGVEHYRGAAELRDPATHALAARVRTITDGSDDPNALAPQTVTLTLRSGQTLKWSCETMLASSARRLPQNMHLEKFRRCLEFSADGLAPGAGEKLIAIVDQLEQVSDVREIVALVAGVAS